MTSCIDLKKRFGKRFFVDIDESYFASSGASKNCCRDPWYYQLPGKRGHICPWGDDLLAVCLNPGQTKVAKRLMGEKWVIKAASQVGDNGEVNAVFHVDDFEKAAAYADLNKRPDLSAAERQRRSERMRDIRNRQSNSKLHGT